MPPNQSLNLEPKNQPVIGGQPSLGPSPASMYPAVGAPLNTIQNPLSNSQLEALHRAHRHWLRLLLLPVLGIALLVAAFFFATRANLRDLVLLKNYRSYAYSNGGFTFQLNYYKGSSVQLDTFNPNSSGEMVLLSPNLPNGALPVQLQIDNTASTAQLNPNDLNCTFTGGSVGFTVYVPAADSNVNMCLIKVNDISAVDVGVFAKDGRHYAIIVNQVYDQAEANSNKTYARQTLGKLGLEPYQSTLKQFVGSLSFSN